MWQSGRVHVVHMLAWVSKQPSADSFRKVVSQRWAYSIPCPQDRKVKTYPNSTNLMKAVTSLKINVGISLRADGWCPSL